MFTLGLDASRQLIEVLKDEDPKEECIESVFSPQIRELPMGTVGTVVTESPLAHAIVSTGAKCIVTLSPTIFDSELASISVFLEKRFAFFRAYSFEGKRIVFKLPESKMGDCSAFLSDPNFPTGKALGENNLKSLIDIFNFLIIDATSSFMSKDAIGSPVSREHAEILLKDYGERTALILRLHDMFKTGRYPAYMILSGSSRFLETFLTLAGWKRNGISCGYRKVLEAIYREGKLKTHAEKLMNESQKVRSLLAKNGWEVFDSDVPYFLARGGKDIPPSAEIFEVKTFLGFPRDVKLFFPSDDPVL
ncbi:MAG: hypothetical protein ACPLSO_07440 [Fervidicoccaceae archaeon]